VIKFSKTSYWNLHNIGGLPIMPKHILDGVEDWKVWQPSREKHPDAPGLTRLIGTGPFVFSEYRPGDFVYFKRNGNFWNPTKTGVGNSRGRRLRRPDDLRKEKIIKKEVAICSVTQARQCGG
jgi:ABC-type transport system substrate-binding protein